MAEPRKISVTLECFVQKDGKYLMLHRSPSKRIMPDVYMAPGGHLEFSEGLFECAKREILEETGLQIKNIKVKAVGMACLKDLNQEIYLHLLLADYASGEVHPEPEDGELVWFSPEEISDLPNLLAELKEVLVHLFDRTDKVVSYKAFYESGNKMTSFELETS